MPSSNIDYWNAKIERNKIRDKKITKALKMSGWQVVRIWEHEIKEGKIQKLKKRLRDSFLFVK